MTGRPTHGLSSHPYYQLWAQMVGRCHNPKHPAFPRYGGRGIEVAEEWRDSPAMFINWVLDELGPRTHRDLSLDRIDNERGYEPGNLRWTNWQVQTRNSRGARLTEKDVKVIRDRDAAGVPHTRLAEDFGITRRNVRSIVQKRTWADPTDAIKQNEPARWSIHRAVDQIMSEHEDAEHMPTTEDYVAAIVTALTDPTLFDDPVEETTEKEKP